MLWGETTVDECVATVHAAVDAGIDLFDLAPRYGDGKAEEVVGAAFDGKLPEGVRVTSKCNLGELPPGDTGGLAPLDRRQPAPAASRPISICSFCIRMLSPIGPSFAQSGCCRADDPLQNVCRPCPAGVREAGRRGADRRLGADRHRASRRDHPAARRNPGAGCGAVHRQPARLAGRPANSSTGRPSHARSWRRRTRTGLASWVFARCRPGR